MTISVLLLLFALLAVHTSTPSASPSGQDKAAPSPTAAGANTASQSPATDPTKKATLEAEQKAGQRAKATVELLTPSPLDVTTNNGAGAMPFRLLITGTAEDIKAIEATAASGDGQALPADVTVQVESSMPLQNDQRVQAAVLIVKASKPLPQNVKFSGMLLIPGLGRVPYSVTDRTNVVLSASPDKLAITWIAGQPNETRLQVRNSGTTSTTVRAGSASLEDAGSKRRVEANVAIVARPGACDQNPPADCTVTVPAGRSQEIVVALPRPPFAGTYAGTLSLRSDADTLSVPLTVTTRGPSLGGNEWAPFLLFVLTLVFGICLSSKLDAFFGDGGGLRRAEAVVALGTLESNLGKERGELDDLANRVAPPLRLPGVLQQFAVLQEEVRRARTVPNTPNIEGTLTTARTAQVAGTLLRRLLEIAVAQLDTAALAEVSKGIEDLSWPKDDATLKTFETGVQEVIRAAHDKMVKRTQAIAAQANQPGVAAELPGPLVLPPGTPVSPAAALRQIRRMALLQQSAIWLVTALTAYQTFYAANAAFGTAAHYAGVFMWALGITQAGTQIVTRARRPANA